MLIKDRAVCIRTADYSETSQVVTLFAQRSGKIRAIAKGSKRAKSAFDGPIEVLSLGDIMFSGVHKDALATLTEFQQQPVRGGLRRNLFALHSALFAAELLDALTDELDPHPALFDHFAQFLQDLDDPELVSDRRDVMIRLILFQVVLLGEAGMHPVLKACANCKRPLTAEWRESYFSSVANGLICRDCEMNFQEKTRLSVKAAHALADLKLMVQADEKLLDEIERLLIQHFTHILGHPLKLARHILPA